MDVKEDQGTPTGQTGTVLWRRRWVKIAGVVVLVALACLVIERALRSHDSPAAAPASRGVASPAHNKEAGGREDAKAGAEAPRISVVTLSGSTFTVPTGKPTALWFTADGCRSCIPKAQALAKIKNEVGDRVAILGVDINPTDTEAIFRRWIQEVGDPPFDFAMDKDGQLTLAWEVRDTSTVVIVDPAGKIVYHSAGAADEATFRAALAKAGLA